MTTRMPWGSYHASAHIDTRLPYISWNSVPWLGIGVLKLWPFTLIFNWPVSIEVDEAKPE